MKPSDFPKVRRRRLFNDIKGGYLESDNDFVRNNFDACVWLLENSAALKKLVLSKKLTKRARLK